MAKITNHSLIKGIPVLVVIDVQKGSFMSSTTSPIKHMPGYGERVARIPALIEKARSCGVPIIFFQEAQPSVSVRLDVIFSVRVVKTGISPLPEQKISPHQPFIIPRKRL